MPAEVLRGSGINWKSRTDPPKILLIFPPKILLKNTHPYFGPFFYKLEHCRSEEISTLTPEHWRGFFIAL